MSASDAQAAFAPLTCGDIIDGLRRLGLRRGDAVEVHSSLSSLGRVAGGAPTVVDALMNVVGPEGALVMSAYALSLPLPLTKQEKARGILAKVRLYGEDYAGPTGMGAIADEFCRRPGTMLGTGLHRVCAWGREAELHRRGYAHLLAIDGWALLIGVDIHRCSSMHAAESSVGLPDAIRRRFEVPQDIRQDYPESDWYIQYGETPRDAWGQIQAKAEHRGLIKQGRIGRAECRLFKARAVVEMYAEALRANPLGLFGVEE